MGILRRGPGRIRGVSGTLADRHILVTGGGGVVGPGIVRVLAEAGADVTFTDIDVAAIATVTRANAHAAGNVSGVEADIRDHAAMTAVLDALATPLDGLVNNVGMDPYPRRPIDLTIPTMESVFRTNVLGPLDLTAAVIERMAAGGRTGSIVFITSIHATVLRGQPGYSATKAALEIAMRELAADAAPHGIRVNAVAPGHVAVNRRDHVIPSRAAPLGRVSLHPIDIGKAVWFLLNDQISAVITGATLTVDRGMSLLLPDW